MYTDRKSALMPWNPVYFAGNIDNYNAGIFHFPIHSKLNP